ncbi:TPA: conjugal transfer protein, partial [Clostridioides difficile]|nr:conjugal transfer protein [Clostridioides difficile]
AIDMHTVHETETIQLRLTDTNGIENFVKNFAKSYYTWNNSKEAIEARTQAISGYLTKELQALNTDTIRKDIPVSSAVNGVQIWSVTQADENQFSVIFTVEQLITENGSTKTVRSAYEVTVYVDGSGNMVLTKNPTITSIPVKSGYTPKAKESDGTVDAVTTDEINEFLTTFFKLYPTATAKELSYYVNEGVLKPIGKDYVFSELVNPIYNRIDSQVTVSVAVKYLDQQTKATQVSQFDLVLEKSGSNWKIIK